MTLQLLARGTTPNHITRYGNNMYGLRIICRAAGKGYTDVVQALLDWGAKNVDAAIVEAISNGHLSTVELLLSHHAKPKWFAKYPARRGRGDIVRVLLDLGGATQRDGDWDVSAVGYAILTEHTAMFQYLMEHGAALPTGASRWSCIHEARDTGVEHMLAMLGPRRTDLGLDMHSGFVTTLMGKNTWR
jgi:ankyrin repeat protein